MVTVSGRRSGVDDLEIDLVPKDVDLDDANRDHIAQLLDTAGATANQTILARTVFVPIVVQ